MLSRSISLLSSCPPRPGLYFLSRKSPIPSSRNAFACRAMGGLQRGRVIHRRIPIHVERILVNFPRGLKGGRVLRTISCASAMTSSRNQPGVLHNYKPDIGGDLPFMG